MQQDVILPALAKEHLDQFSLDNLSKFARGKAGRIFQQVHAQVLTHLINYPVRDGKPEHADITIKINLRNLIEFDTVVIEEPSGNREAKIPRVKGIVGSVKIKSGIEAIETDDVTMATEVKNGRIVDVRFNPDSNNEPLKFDQKKFPYGEENDDE